MTEVQNTGGAGTRPLNILIVDDSAMMRMMIKRVAGLCEIPIQHIYEAANGAEALEVLATKDVDALFTEYCDRAYGAASEPMQRLWILLDDASSATTRRTRKPATPSPRTSSKRSTPRPGRRSRGSTARRWRGWTAPRPRLG